MLLRHIVRQLVGVSVAVIGGWLAGILFELCWTVVDMFTHSSDTPAIALFVRPWIVALGSAYFIVPVVLVLLPMYLFIPRSAPVWRPIVCTVLGIAAGTLIVFAMLSRPNSNPPESKFSWYLLAAVIGGATCFIGAVTRDRFAGDTSRI